MLPLRSKYHREIIKGVIWTKNADFLGRVVLSSPELSRTFGVFIRKVNVDYCQDRICFTLSSYCPVEMPVVNADSYHWIAKFIRILTLKLNLEHADPVFLDKIHRCNNFADLNLTEVEGSASLEAVKNLIPITQRLSINDDQLSEVQNLLPRFETLILRAKDEYYNDTDDFVKVVNMHSQNLLQLFTQEMPFYDSGPIHSFAEKFENLHTLYLVWDLGHSPMSDVVDMLDFACTFFPNVKNVHLDLDLEWRCSLSDCRREYKTVAAKLRRLPAGVKVKVGLRTSLCDYRRVNQARRNANAKRLFGAADFVFTTDPGYPTISNRQKNITDNVEFSFAFDLGDIDDIF